MAMSDKKRREKIWQSTVNCYLIIRELADDERADTRPLGFVELMQLLMLSMKFILSPEKVRFLKFP